MENNIKTLDDFINSEYFETYEESWYSNLVCSPWNNDLIERIHEAAEDGSDGRTNEEVMELWQESLDDCYDDVVSYDTKKNITVEIKDCVLWHEKNGSLFKQLG